MRDEAPSHRNLGPIAPPTHATRGGRAAPALAPQFGGEFHHFGGKNSKRRILDPLLLQRLGQLLQSKASASSPKLGYLNPPDALTGAGGIPSGYTYLFQLAAHDVVQTSLQVRPKGDAKHPLIDPDRPRNLRRTPLALETVLGGGALACPFAYDIGNGPARLRLGYVRQPIDGGGWKWSPPARDLPRITFRADGLAPTSKQGLETVLIPDARNDDNLLLAQLTVLFAGLHNLLRDKLVESAALPEHAIEETARRLFVRLFRRILRHDLLRRILHPEIHRLYDQNQIRLDIPREEGSVSIEFAFAAARLGHGMVRDSYRLNTNADVPIPLATIIQTSSSHMPRWVPIKREDLVDWSLFFEPETGAPPQGFNWALRFGPHVAAGMMQPAAAKTLHDPTEGAEPLEGTVYRDLLRESSGVLIRLSQLADLAQASPPGVGWGAALDHVRDTAMQQRVIRAGLESLNWEKVLSKEDVSDLIDDPPLSLFFMFEAQQFGAGGRTLGPLGSIVVAEAMAPAFYPEPWETKDLILNALETDVLRGLPDTMPALLALLRQSAPEIFAT